VRRKFDALIPVAHTEVISSNIAELVASCEIDHSVRPVPVFRGGSAEAHRRLKHFLRTNLRRYSSFHNEPSARATSSLSPYLHFVIYRRSKWRWRCRITRGAQTDGRRVPGGVNRPARAGVYFARFTDNIESLESLPRWARETWRNTRATGAIQYTLATNSNAHKPTIHCGTAQKELLLRARSTATIACTGARRS